MTIERSERLLERAARTIPGGVNSPVRAFGAVGGTPRFIERGAGARIFDVDGNGYVDLIGSWGPMILGHAHPEVVEAIARALRDGTSFGAPTLAEVELAEKIVEMVPSVDMVRLLSSGTEATMTAARLARGHTGRDRILKFEGCYHGHGDTFLIKAGSGSLTFGVPSSPGVPAPLAELTLTARYNDLDGVRELFDRHREEIAAVIVEPVAGNMGTVPPRPGFLQGLRELTASHGALLIFDEVMTGFRVAPGGAQELYGIDPDLTTLGKIVGGGMPLAALGGRREILEDLSPVGPVYQAGTLSGNPLATAAGNATLDVIRREGAGLYEKLEERGSRLERGLRDAMPDGSSLSINRVGSMLTLFLGVEEVRNFDDATGCDTEMFGKYFQGMLRRGIYLPPSAFEALFVSLAHSDQDIDRTIEAAKATLAEIAG